jgi:hypothetical protein
MPVLNYDFIWHSAVVLFLPEKVGTKRKRLQKCIFLLREIKE